MRVSQWAVFTDYGLATLAFNTLTKEFLSFDIDYTTFKSYLATESLPAEIMSVLCKGCFLMEDNHDEYNDFLLTYRQARYGPQPLVIYLTPTLKCNASCEYCFQRDIRPDLPPESGPPQEMVILFVASKLQDATGLKITWFGGEPLLKATYIDHLSRNLIRLVEMANKPYSASMVTNGLLLDKARVEMLLRSQIYHLQISLDGPEAIHNAIGRRDAKRGYREIINNVLRLPEEIKVALRINVSRRNIASIPQLLDDLATDGLTCPNVTLDFASVYDFSINNLGTCYLNTAGYVLPNQAYSELQLQLEAYAEDLGFRISMDDLLIPGSPLCHAIKSKGYAIWPDGSVTRCIHEVKTLEDVNIRDSDHHRNIDHVPSLQRWITAEVFTTEPCRTCFYLPMCGGNCAHARFLGVKPPQSCPPSKWTLKQRMRWYEASATGERKQIGTKRDRLIKNLAKLAAPEAKEPPGEHNAISSQLGGLSIDGLARAPLSSSERSQ